MYDHQATVPKNGWARKTLPPLPATARAVAWQPQSWKRKQPDGKIPSSSLSMNPRVARPQRKGTGKKWETSSPAIAPTSHQGRRRQGRAGYRAERNAQRRTPAQNPEPKPPSTPTKPKFSRKTKLAKDVKNRRGSGSCHNLNMTEAIAPKARAQETK